MLVRARVLLRPSQSSLRRVHNQGSGADDYYGPGGLSARQIFEKVQESRKKEAEAQQALNNRKTATEAIAQQGITEEMIATQSSKQLRDLLMAKQVDLTGCFERDDLVSKARIHLLAADREPGRKLRKVNVKSNRSPGFVL